MNRRGLLKGMLALPVAGALGCRHERGEGRPKVYPPDLKKLRVVVTGAFAIVLQTDSHHRVRVFSPKERSGLHRFHFNDPSTEEDKALKTKSGERTFHFELLRDGLAVEPKPPKIDDELADFSVATDLWCQEDYFVTIDLPPPQRITYVPPLTKVTFCNGEKTGRMAPSHVLEYNVTDPDKVRMSWQGEKEIQPTTCADLVKRYERFCSEQADERMKSACSSLQGQYPSFCPEGEGVFFFGVGLPPNRFDLGHAIEFFNQRILASFPRLRRQLKLDSVADNHGRDDQMSSLQGRTVPAVFNQETPRPRLLQVASVLDCHVAGPIVSFPGTTTS